jgi:dephospho-CoA kinase
MIIGITGDIGSGKSTFAKLLSSFIIVPYYDLDQVAKATMHYNSLQVRDICQKHGMPRNGDYRDFLHEHFFAIPELQTELAECIKKGYPMRFILRQTADNKIIESAILYQQGLDKLCDVVIHVTVNDEIRYKRLIEKRGMGKEDIDQRLKTQRLEWYDPDKHHFTVDNSGNEANLISRAKEIADELKNYGMEHY